MFDCTLRPPSERETPVSMTRAVHLAWLPLSLAIRRKFDAMHTSFHSTLTRCRLSLTTFEHHRQLRSIAG